MITNKKIAIKRMRTIFNKLFKIKKIIIKSKEIKSEEPTN
jgi:hypothetical protein